jgi:hypothetical protein
LIVFWHGVPSGERSLDVITERNAKFPKPIFSLRSEKKIEKKLDRRDLLLGRLRIRNSALRVFQKYGSKSQFRRLLNCNVVLQHVNRFPGTVLGAQSTSDAPIEIHFDKLSQIKVFRPGDKFNTINGTNHDASLTTGTTVLINDSQLFWLLLSWRFMRIHSDRFTPKRLV